MAQGYVDASAAYNAGWAAAAAKFYRSYNTIWGPSSTVGQSKYAPTFLVSPS